MRLMLRFSFVAAFASTCLFAVGFADLLQRNDITSDVCGDVSALLKVPVLGTGILVTIGLVQACLCQSSIVQYATTNPLTIGAISVSTQTDVVNALNALLSQCSDKQTCSYPSHSLPQCNNGSPCGFTCKDGYSPSPSNHPTQCVCQSPNTECNGKCGVFHGCPTGHARREMRYGGGNCPRGLSACGVWGRNARTWECIDTQNDLESCGGCVIPHPFDESGEGQDCTAIPGVSDVSCIKGKCSVHRCMPGYDLDGGTGLCIYSEDKDPVLLASQFGLEYNEGLNA